MEEQLFEASSRGYLESVKSLLAQGVDMEYKDVKVSEVIYYYYLYIIDMMMMMMMMVMMID